MPANNELTSFWNMWNADRTGFRAKLIAAGYKGMVREDYYYWSLTEYSNQYACYIHLTNSSIYNSWYDKAYSHFKCELLRSLKKEENMNANDFYERYGRHI